MGNTRTISKKQNRGKGCAAPWSDLDHNLLHLVLMKLQVIDFVPFSGVCKSWRSLALSEITKFIASRPPMKISISEPAIKKEYWMENFQRKMLKMPLPKSGGDKILVGITCGYLVFFGTKPREFQLLNPVTRHGLRFPKVPKYLIPYPGGVRAILVFSPLLSASLFVVLCKYSHYIYYSIAGAGEWNCVHSDFPILDVHEFKGKIYAIDTKSHLYEAKLHPDPKLTLLGTQNILESDSVFPEFVCTCENLFAINCYSIFEYEVNELDFGEMKWVSPDQKTRGKNAFFLSHLRHSAAFKLETELWFDSWLPHKRRYTYSDDSSGTDMFFNAYVWYFPHDCLNVNLKHE